MNFKAHLPAVSGMLLITGTSIGAGMLALPVVTGLAGFLPALAINFICSFFMMVTGLLFLEAILWSHDGANVLSLSEHFLGKWGKFVAGVTFLFLYYCLMVSYFAGGSPALASLLSLGTGNPIAAPWNYVLFTGLFGAFVLLGTKAVDRVNWLLMIGLVLSFLLLIMAGSQAIQPSLLKRADWNLSLAAAPILFGAYGYHNLLPSLSTYLKRHVNHLRFSIVFGTMIPFVVYSVWQLMIIGTLTLEEIQTADLNGEPITQTLQTIVGHPWLALFGEFFGFFALVTSFLGVSLSMVDFLGDGIGIHRRGWNRFFLCVLVFIPPAIFASLHPRVFIEAIGVAGGFGEAILNGLLPIGMVWVGHHTMGKHMKTPIIGNRGVLLLLTAFTLLIMAVEAYHLLS